MLFVIRTELLSPQLAVLDLASGEVAELGLAGVSPHYVSTGHLVYADQDASVRAVAFDVASLEVTGSPVPLVEGVMTKRAGAADFSISAAGRLVYVQGALPIVLQTLVWVDREGREEPVGDQPRRHFTMSLSPDGSRSAHGFTDESGNLDIWILELTREGALARLTGSVFSLMFRHGRVRVKEAVDAENLAS